MSALNGFYKYYSLDTMITFFGSDGAQGLTNVGNCLITKPHPYLIKCKKISIRKSNSYKLVPDVIT
jgi:hypothetical protein